MIATSYRKSKGSSGRTLSVTFEDEGLEYLDKTIVLLNYKHLNNASLSSRAIKLGYMFAPSPDKPGGGLERYYGTYRQGVDIKYNLTDLAIGMAGRVPMSERLNTFLRSFGPSLANASDAAVKLQGAFLRSESGTLRGVLGSISGAMGVMIFWNNENGGQLDLIRMEDNIDASLVSATAGSVGTSCNVIDSAEEVSIKNCHVVGCVGSFSATNQYASSGRSEKLARFKFMDTLTTPYGDETIDLVGEGEIIFDTELLLKAASVSTDYYKRFVLMKKIAEMAEEERGADIRNEIIEKDNQDFNGDQKQLTEADRGFRMPNTPKDLTRYLSRNKAVEKLYPYSSSFPSGNGNGTFLVAAYSGPKGGLWDDIEAADEHTVAGLHLWTHITEDDSFIAECGETNPWVGCVFKLGSNIDTVINKTSEDPVYKMLKFISQNFGRYYYSVSGRGGGVKSVGGEAEDPPATPRPALVTQECVSERTYTEDGPSWVFSDLAITDSSLSEVWNFTNGIDEENNKKWERGPYAIMKMGQSAPETVFLPCDVISPSKRFFETEGYTELQSVYDYIRYFPDGGCEAVTRATGGEGGCGPGGGGSSEYYQTSSFKKFAVEVYGVISSTDIKKYTTTAREDFCSRGGGMPKGGCSLSSEDYGEINNMRGSCEGQVGAGFKFPTNADFGILLLDAYKGGGSSDGVDLKEFAFSQYNADKVEVIFSVKGGTGFPKGGKEGIGIFIMAVPDANPLEALVDQLKKPGFEDIDPDEVDVQLGKIELPFTLASVQDNKNLDYSVAKDDRLLTFRSSFIPQGAPGATSMDVRDVSFDVAELQTTMSLGTEFPRCEKSSVINLQQVLHALNAVLRSYVDVQLEPSVSYDFTVLGFGFGDGEFIPSIRSGLESVSIQLGANGATTQIKIGNKRRTRSSDELRKAVVMSKLAGMPMASTSQGSVSTTMSNSFKARI
tara:strand:- start:2537 stop:5389 length:2853 start_codon:yes stop_codon:yes gene_type:complete